MLQPPAKVSPMSEGGVLLVLSYSTPAQKSPDRGTISSGDGPDHRMLAPKA